MSSVEELKKAPSVKELYFSYFIGRCNPPHQGHFHMIREAILAANRPGIEGKALILLGSGPKAKYGTNRRTEKDPLTFDFKKEIIEKNITNCVDKNEDKYEIVEMTNPTAQVIEFVETELQSQLINNDVDTTLIKIKVEHFAGAKENDATKLEFVRRALENKIKEEYNIDIKTKAETDSLNLEETNDIPMSATLIRNDANNQSISKDFISKYFCLYGDDTERVYKAIIEGKQIGENTLKKYTDSKTRKKKVCKSESAKISKCGKMSGGKRKTNKRKTNKRKTNKRKINKRRKTNKRKKMI